MGVPYTFATATTSIPLSQLDANFNTPVTIGTSTVGLGNTTTSLVGLSNVSTTIVGSTGNLSIQSSSITAVTIDTSQRVVVNGSYGGGVFDSTAPGIYFNRQSNTTEVNVPFIRSVTENSTTSLQLGPSSTSGSLQFFTYGSERARIDASGNLLVNQTSVTGEGSGSKLCVTSTTGASGNNCAQFTNNTTNLDAVVIQTTTGNSGNYYQMAFRVGTSGGIGTQVGGIQSTSSSTSYVTSSDYRLKENIQPMTGALATVSQLKPVTYDWIVDKSKGQGFIAHELQAIVPDCVTGEKDAVDAEGNPVYQGIDTSFLVATLTAAIQELNATLTTQATTIASLQSEVLALKNLTSTATPSSPTV